MNRPALQFKRIYAVLASAMVLLAALRAYLVPFSHDEVATFYFYIQPGKFIPFSSHVDANGHFLTSALGWLCFKMFGSSPFSLRLPSLAALVLLCYAVSRCFSLFRFYVTRIAFAAGFLLFYTFLSYFSLCRGYGISMACLVMAVCYWHAFISGGMHRHFIKFSLFMQLALAANLTLIFVAGICLGICFVFHIKRKGLGSAGVVIVYLVNAALLLFWVAYAFYLRNNGALYYGAGSSYWQVTFVSLMENLYPSVPAVRWVIVALAAITAVVWAALCLKNGQSFIKTPAFWSFILFTALVLCFYLLNKVASVNFPEDRTGLFFYVFFVFAICSAWDGLNSRIAVYVPLLWAASGCIMVATQVDLRNHPWAIYETMPASFFDRLVKEQSSGHEPVTVGGHRIREFIYGFLNHRSEKKLSHMTSPEALQMNCDYALAVKADEPWYREYYDELATEDKWGFRLLKRRLPLTRKVIREFGNPADISGEPEYYNFFEVADTVLGSVNPLLAEVSFRIVKAPRPFRAWIVFQIDAQQPEDNIFVRTPLDLVAGDWESQGETTLCLVTGSVPLKIKRMVLYLWNIDRAPVEMKVKGSRLLRLEGAGVNVISKAKL